MAKASKKNEAREENPIEEVWPKSDFEGHDQPIPTMVVNREELETVSVEPTAFELGVSSEGPFIAPLEEVAAAVTSMIDQSIVSETARLELDKRFSAFKEDLFKLCYRHGFVLTPYENIKATDAKTDKSRLNRVRRVADALNGLELNK